MVTESDKLKAKYADNETYGPVFELDGLDHDVYMDGDVMRWVESPSIDFLRFLNNDYGMAIDPNRVFDLNHFWNRCRERGITKNDSRVRQLYRDMGYSVFGYWEVFFWEVNNDIAHEWKGERNGPVISDAKKSSNATVKARPKKKR